MIPLLLSIVLAQKKLRPLLFVIPSTLIKWKDEQHGLLLPLVGHYIRVELRSAEFNGHPTSDLEQADF